MSWEKSKHRSIHQNRLLEALQTIFQIYLNIFQFRGPTTLWNVWTIDAFIGKLTLSQSWWVTVDFINLMGKARIKLKYKEVSKTPSVSMACVEHSTNIITTLECNYSASVDVRAAYAPSCRRFKSPGTHSSTYGVAALGNAARIQNDRTPLILHSYYKNTLQLTI